MKRPVSLGLLAIASFAIGAFVAGRCGWGAPLVGVELVNATGQQVNELQVKYRGARSEGAQRLPDLAPAAHQVVRLHVIGESTFQFSGRLSNGAPLVSIEQYVEPGYHVTHLLVMPATPPTAEAVPSSGPSR